MKRLLLMGIITILFFSSCKKDNTVYQTYFWTSMDTTSVKLNLYIDDTFVQSIKYSAQRPDCNNDSLLAGFTSIGLTAGSYQFQAKTGQNNIVFSSAVIIKSDGSVNSSKIHGKIDIYGDRDRLCFGISN